MFNCIKLLFLNICLSLFIEMLAGSVYTRAPSPSSTYPEYAQGCSCSPATPAHMAQSLLSYMLLSTSHTGSYSMGHRQGPGVSLLRKISNVWQPYFRCIWCLNSFSSLAFSCFSPCNPKPVFRTSSNIFWDNS